MANKKLDHARIRSARLHGLPNSLIAERLNCSERQVRRINADLKDTPVDIMTGTEFEFALYATQKFKRGKSLRQIAYTYCVSHEHVRKELKYTNQEAA